MTPTQQPKNPKANKRTEDQKIADIEVISFMRLRGRSLADIAAHIGSIRPYTLSTVQIYKDIERARDEWRANSAAFIKEGQQRIDETLCAAAAEAWQQWDESKKKKGKSSITQAVNEQGQAIPGATVRRVITEDSVGDPAYLRLIVDIAERRAKLLGLNAATKVELSGADGTPLVVAAAPIINILMPEGSYDPFTFTARGISPSLS